MSTTARINWKTEEQINEQEYRAGYDIEATPGSLRSDKRDDGDDDELEYNHMEGMDSETTFYADRPKGSYNPYESLPTCEWYNRKQTKYARLWKINAGLDEHTAAGKTYKDVEISKVNQPARDRARFVHGVASECELSQGATDRATSIARKLDPRAFNYWGGMDVFILAVVGFVATTTGDLWSWSGCLKPFHDIREQWNVSINDLAAAVEKVGEKIGYVK